MRKEKIKLFFAKYSTAITIITIIVGLLIIAYFIKKTDVLSMFKDISDTEFAVYGTLLGAIVGGVFTLIGTSFVNKQQLKAQTQIKRKNLIYKPLYDELMEIQEDYMKQNPFPNYVAIGKSKTSMPRFSPQYTVWERIKADTRYFEVPESLKKEIKILHKYIEDYLVAISDLNTIIKDILNTTLQTELSTECTIVNIGDVLSGCVLTESNLDIFNHLNDALKPKIEIDDENREKVSNLFYEKCKQNKQIQTIKKARKLWFEQQKRVLELLTTLISFVTIKYEG